MKRNIITIHDDGTVSIPSETKMSISEIADLFGIYYQTAKGHIRTIEKSGIANGDYAMSCTLEGQNIYPDYYGSDMIIALVFQVQSEIAEVFRKWILRKASKSEISEMLVLSAQNPILN